MTNPKVIIAKDRETPIRELARRGVLKLTKKIIKERKALSRLTENEDGER